MARDLFINGETMVSVKGPAGTSIASLTQLGLADSPIRVRLNFKHKDVNVDAWGSEVPVDVQGFLADATVSMRLIHVERTVLDECIALSMISSTIGQVSRAGARMGSNSARFAATSSFIGLNLYSPVAGKPWRFYYTYLANSFETPLGSDRSTFDLTWRAIPYTNDPWGGGTAQPTTVAGTGAANAVLWDYTLDS